VASDYRPSRVAAGVVTLGEVAARFSVLDVACNRCERRGRYHIYRLVERRGAGLPIPELRHVLAADCPRMIDGKAHDVCGVHFPTLSGSS
jgi:hypothetical protein